MSHRRRWRNASHLYFPELNVFATTIAKVGNTAIKSFLVAAEQIAHQRRPEFDDPETALQESAPQGMAVHDDHSILRDYRHPGPPPPGAVTLIVLRDPVERFLSMWVDRFLLQQHGGTLGAYHSRHPEWFGYPQDDLATARARVQGVVEACADDEVLFTDVHWVPQYAWLTSVDDYRIVLDIGELARLPQALADADEHLAWLSQVPMLTRHESSKQLQQLLLTEELAARILERYDRDVRLRARFGLSETWPRLLGSMSQQEQETQWESLQDDLYRQQFDARLKEVTRLQARIDHFESRLIFKAYLRTRHIMSRTRDLAKSTRTSLAVKRG